MMDYNRHFRTGQSAPSLEIALGLPVTALLGVPAAAADLLGEIGVSSVFDLGASALFAKAGMVAEAAGHGGVTSVTGAVPGDWLSEAWESLEDLGTAPIAALRGLTAEQAAALSELLDVTSIRDLAAWPPRRAAHDMVAEAAGSTVPDSTEPGDELRPRLGEFPTERVYYDRLIMLSQGGSETTTEIQGPIALDPAMEQPLGFGRPAVGALATFSQSWFAKGVTLGQMLHSLALAPGEATRIAVIDWARRTRAAVQEDIAESEMLDSAATHSRAISEVQNAVATEMQEGESMSSGWASSSSEAEAYTDSSGFVQSVLASSGSYSYGTQSARSRSGARSTSWSSGTRSIVGEMAQNVNDRTEQHSNSVRNRRASAVREVSQSEHESVSTRIVANYNHMHALTIQYYEVVQVYRVETRLHRAVRCLFLPFELPDFAGARGQKLVERFRASLLDAALTPRVRELLIDETANVKLRPMVKVALPEFPFPGGEAITANEIATEMMALSAAAPTATTGNDEGSAAPTPVFPSKAIIWSAEDIARVTLAIGRQIVRPGSNAIHLPEDTQLLGISFSFVHIGSVRLERPGPGDAVHEVPGGSARVDLPPGTRLSDIEAILVARAANDSLHAGSMTLHCSYRGRPFSAPDIVLQLAMGTHMQKVLQIGTDRMDRQKELIDHLRANATHYGQAILARLTPATLMSLLSGLSWNGKPVADVVEPDIVAVAGNYVVLRAPVEPDDRAGIAGSDMSWATLMEDRRLDRSQANTRTIPIPTDGVFAEAVLGRSNSAEKLDITRFWNWQDSPIPMQPPEIAPVGTGSRGQAETLTPGELSSPVLNIVNPTALPDPAGLGAGLSALATSNLFRDMSGLQGTQSLASGALEQAAQAATQAGQIASTNMQTEAQKAVAMSRIAADIAKAAMGMPSDGKTDSITADGARINHGRDMDERGVTGKQSQADGTGGIDAISSADPAATPRPGNPQKGGTKEADYADKGAYKYSPSATKKTLSSGPAEGDFSVPPGATVKDVSFDALDAAAATETNFKIAEEKIASYINLSVMLFKEGHSQATKDFAVWFRGYLHRKQTSSKSIVEVLGTTLFRVILDHLIVGPGALAKAIRSIGNKVLSKNLSAALSSGSVDPDAFLAVLARQESSFVDMLGDMAIVYRNDDTGNYQEALHTFINDFEKDVDSKYGIPNSVKEILENDGIPEPSTALRRTVREEVLTRMIQVIYENTITTNGENVADFEGIPSRSLAMIEALHEIDPKGNMERICELESLRHTFFRTYCRGD